MIGIVGASFADFPAAPELHTSHIDLQAQRVYFQAYGRTRWWWT
jgi:hypothetical protein